MSGCFLITDNNDNQRTTTLHMHTIYCAGYGDSSGYIVIALADDGHGLAQHLCSHQGYARHDIGMDGTTRKHEYYDKHFGAGNWQLEWVDDVKTHPGWQTALALKRQLLPDDSE